MADPKDEITTQDILAQYGPTPQAKPKDEHGFLFSNVGGELKFNPWEHIKGFMGYRAPPGALSTSGDSKPIEDAFNAAGWVGLSGMGLNAFGAVPANAVGSAGARLAGKAMPAVERELDDLGFYSAALEGAKTWPMPQGTREQALAHLKKSGIKDAEISATGLDKYLAEQDVVSRQAMEDYLRQNRVKVERDVYGGVEPEMDLTKMERNRLDDGTIEHIFEDDLGRMFQIVEDKDAGNFSVYGPRGEHIPINAPMNNMREAHARDAIRDWIINDAKPKGTKDIAQFAENSGDPTNPAYRESILRLQMPERVAEMKAQKSQMLAEQKKLDNMANNFEWNDARAEPYRDKARELTEKMIDLDAEMGTILRNYMPEAHFPGRGVISHSQLAMQPDIEGRSWMTPWQVQSDWGQAIRTSQHDLAAQDLFKKPYKKLTQEERAEVSKAMRSDPNKYPPGRNEQKITEIEERAKVANAALDEAVNAGRQQMASLAGGDFAGFSPKGIRDFLINNASSFLRSGEEGAANKLVAMATAIDDAQKAVNLITPELRTATASPPANPMVNTTDQWVTTQLRNVLKHAADEDAHGIALPRGETVLTYNPGDEHGMAGFYDNILQRAMAKEMKRLDPSIKGPEEVRLLPHEDAKSGHFYREHQGGDWRELHASDHEGSAFERPFYGYPLTEKVKEEIRKGLPLFSMPGIPVADLLRAYYGEDKE